LSRWTEEQARAIESRNSNLLLAAAAGSGKTAVLVERVINLIIRDGMDIDRLLIVTFTQAAAAEMRERINGAIFAELQKGVPEQQGHLRRQLSLLNQASISTIHSFCREVVKRFHFMLDIDPNFRIADDSESAIIKMDVMDELIESEYELAETEFIELVEMFGGSKSDLGLLDLIGRTHAFVQSQPEPEKWLRESAEHFAMSLEEFTHSPWMQEVARQSAGQLEASQDMLRKALTMCEKPGGPAEYVDIILKDIELMEELMRVAETEPGSFYEKLHSLSFPSLKRAGKDTDVYLKEKAQKWRGEGKKLAGKLQKGLMAKQPQQYWQDLNAIYPYMRYLTELVLKFAALYQQQKMARNILDFNDLEHFALEILKDPSAAQEYRQRYQHIFVDEYQDSNLLQESILVSICRDNNRFMVGDIKQSIYRFRNADPSLFLEKYLRFSAEEGERDQRIDLGRNFRSRAGILAGINYLFQQIMSRELGEIDYDQKARLYPGLDNDVSEDSEIELILVEKAVNDSEREEELTAELEELSDIAVEARIAASRVKQMAGSMIYDPRQGEWRQADYRDIVILMRAARRWANEFLEVFRAEGIPVYSDSSGGYFEATEVDLILNLLKIIDNRRQDIPLLSVMRSPIGGFDLNELSDLRLGLPRGSYYQVLEHYTGSCSDMLSQKIRLFLQQLDHWREESRLMPVDEFINHLLMDTGYYYYVGSMPGGRQRQANLEVLVNRARQFQDSSIKGLFNFTRFIENIKSSSSDLDTARVLGENDNVVRIMSIHKSKGLEFPVVIIAGLGKGFNEADIRGRVLFHSRLGMGPLYIRSDLRTRSDTIARSAMQHRIKVENLSEEMRILYVAMTRAQSKLILLGSLKYIEKEAERWCGASNIYERLRARTYLDWIGPALARHAGTAALRLLGGEAADGIQLESDESRWQIQVISRYDLQAEESRKIECQQEFRSKLENYQADCNNPETEAIIRRLNWRYPCGYAVNLPSKLSVSQIKGMGMDEVKPARVSLISPGEIEPGNINTNQDSALGSMEKGTLMHVVMEHIEFQPYHSREEIEEQIELLVNKELLKAEEVEWMDINVILAFFQSSLGQRALQASTIYRETPFNRLCPAGEIIKGAEGIGEELLIQGIIDLYFIEGSEAVLVDYKTDRLTPANRRDRIELYRLQLEQYQKAIEQIQGIRVKESYLYFLLEGEAVRIV